MRRELTADDRGRILRLESGDDGDQVLADALVHLRLPRPPLRARSLEDPISLYQLFLERHQVLAACSEVDACQASIRMWALAQLDWQSAHAVGQCLREDVPLQPEGIARDGWTVAFDDLARDV